MRHKGLIQTARLLLAFIFLVSLAAPTQAAAGIFKLIFPSMPIQYQNYDSELSLQNTGVTDATINVDLYNFSGVLVTSHQDIIPAGSAKQFSGANLSAAPGNYQVFISSSSPITGVMSVLRLPGTLAGQYLGQTSTAAQTRLFFGPVDKHSAVSVTNVNPNPAQVTYDVIKLDGSNVVSVPYTVAPYGAFAISLANRPEVPADFSGYVVATGTLPILGLENYMAMTFAGTYQVMHMFLPMATASQVAYARVQNQVFEYTGYRTTNYFLLNPGTAEGTYNELFMNADGTIRSTKTSSLPPYAAQITQLSTLPALQSETTYGLAISGDQPAAFNAWTYYLPSVPDTSSASYATETASEVYLPRLVNETNRHSIISLYNPGAVPATTTLFINMPGAGAFSKQVTLAANGSARVNLKDIATALSTSPGSGKITAGQPITAVVDEFFTYAPPCGMPQVTLARSPEGTVSPSDLVTFTASATGDAPLHYAWTLDSSPVGSDTPAYAANLPEGSHTVEVTVTNTCGSATASSTVSVVVPCVAPSLKLAQSPAGVIYSNAPIQFTATPSGTPPFHYAWTVDGAGEGEDSPGYSVTLPPGDHAVSATITNACSASDYTSTRAFTVLPPPMLAPEYDLSTLSASASQAEANQAITYVAVLRNTGTSSANPVTYTNPLPPELTYTPNSATASDGSPVLYNAASSTLTWTGSLDFGSPVVILYAATVTTPPAGGEILNEATLKDSSNTSAALSVSVPFKVGYGLKINDGALGTNSLTVNLSFTYDAVNDGVVSYRLGNEAKFDPALGATGWLPLTTSPQVHPDWMLDPYGDPRQPRSVYILFKTGTDQEIGPFSASILYDVQPPAAPEVDLSPAAESSPLLRANASPYQWQVITTDDNSGVVMIQIGSRADFSSQVTDVPVTGRVTTFDWRPAESGPVYLRAVDRSGNTSEVTIRQGSNYIFLPALLH